MNAKGKVKKLILEMLNKIIVEYQPEKVILFGSYAYGEPTQESDIDLMIIKNTLETPCERWMQVKKILRDPNRIIPVSPLVYTEEELESRKAMKDFFINEIMEKGEVIYG